MRVYPQLPSRQWFDEFISVQHSASYSYHHVGASLDQFPAGYDHDRKKVMLGKGMACFEQAKEGIRQWKMFPPSWTRIIPQPIPIIQNQSLAMCARLFGMWWINACRIVYTIDEERRFGFAYGTLPAHIEKGEEIFMVRMDEDDNVWYHIEAFSKPQHFLAKGAYWFVRTQQQRFGYDSLKAMQEWVSSQNG